MAELFEGSPLPNLLKAEALKNGYDFHWFQDRNCSQINLVVPTGYGLADLLWIIVCFLHRPDPAEVL
jgi:hypothetical protein